MQEEANILPINKCKCGKPILRLGYKAVLLTVYLEQLPRTWDCITDIKTSGP